VGNLPLDAYELCHFFPGPRHASAGERGDAELVFTTSSFVLNSFRCAKSPSDLCLVAERSSDHLVFTSFDPICGRGKEAARYPIVTTPDATYAWDLSPDGSTIAIVLRSQKTIHLLSLSGGAPREFSVHGANSLQSLDWTTDAKALYAANFTKQGAALLRVALSGKPQLLWQDYGTTQPFSAPFCGGLSVPWAVPSPDGRHLALPRWQMNANMWMLQNL